MNKLIALSVLLLIGCSPASPDESEITIGRPEKDKAEEKATTYPIPLGIWKSEKYDNAHDFTDLPYETENRMLDIDKFLNKDKEIEYKIFITVLNSDKFCKGYWYKQKDTFYVRYIDADEEVMWIDLSYKSDRGSLIGQDGIRWYRQEGK